MQERRPLHEIAADIRRHWNPVNYAAKPYLEAMATLNSVDDAYGAEQADWIVRYFLSNANTWRGADARRIKTELQKLLR